MFAAVEKTSGKNLSRTFDLLCLYVALLLSHSVFLPVYITFSFLSKIDQPSKERKHPLSERTLGRSGNGFVGARVGL